MILRGIVKDGVVVLEDQTLPDGTLVEVLPLPEGCSSGPTAPEQGLHSLADALKDVIGKAGGLPADSSKNYRHYLYGTEKRT